MRQRIRIREQLPVWGLRAILGVILLTLSELVMWQNPPARSLLDWPILLVLYIALAATLMDLTVRFQVRSIATLLLACGVYGLLSAAIVNHSAFDNLPYGLIVRGMGLQTAAGLYGMLLYIAVMRGKPLTPLHLAGAVAVGVLWGIWVHWYPLRSTARWGLVSLETATYYILPALVLVGALVIGAAPRFRFFREKQLELLWWEAIVVAIPLFVALIVGMFQDAVPFLWLLVVIGIGAFMVWALSYQQHGYEPSIMAEVIFPAPNAVSYIILALAFLLTGSLAYGLIVDADSPIGIGVYLLILAFGFAWLPVASLWIFWRALREQNAPGKEDEDV